MKEYGRFLKIVGQYFSEAEVMSYHKESTTIKFVDTIDSLEVFLKKPADTITDKEIKNIPSLLNKKLSNGYGRWYECERWKSNPDYIVFKYCIID